MPTIKPRLTLQIPGKPGPLKEALTTLCILLDRETAASLEENGIERSYSPHSTGRAVRVAVYREIARLKKAGISEWGP